MPSVSANEIIKAIIDAFRQLGATAYYVSDTLQTHPRKFVISYYGEIFSVWVYIWSSLMVVDIHYRMNIVYK